MLSPSFGQETSSHGSRLHAGDLFRRTTEGLAVAPDLNRFCGFADRVDAVRTTKITTSQTISFRVEMAFWRFPFDPSAKSPTQYPVL